MKKLALLAFALLFFGIILFLGCTTPIPPIPSPTPSPTPQITPSPATSPVPTPSQTPPELSPCEDSGGKICQDFEVCQGSILPAADSHRCCNGACRLPESFDWRNRHGENWMTPVKNQGGFGSCQTFGKTGTQEARINLYFNQHIDVDLSEQYILDCSSFSVEGDYVPGPPLGIHPFAEYYPECAEPADCNGCILAGKSKFICPGAHYCAQEIHGIVDENCYPYKERADAFECTAENICPDWEERLWKIGGHLDLILITENPDYPNCSQIEIIERRDQIKKALIKYGPLEGGYELWGHSMVLAGYDGNNWIYKNSWGEGAGEQGYEIIESELQREYYAFTGKVIPPTRQSYEIKCVDKDGDGFCNWGISDIPKPANCPATCKYDEKDWDDSNSAIGAIGLYDE